MNLPARWMVIVCIMSVLVAACSGDETAPITETPTPVIITATPDPCLEANLPAEVAKVNELMREFDDYSALASNTPQAQLVNLIPELQRILRAAEDQPVPVCLQTLKKHQLAHMAAVVQTLLAFLSGADANLINTGIGKARSERANYDIEMARLLGITVVAPTSLPPTGIPPTSTPTPLVLNPGPNGIFLRSAPDFNASQAGVLAVQQSAPAVGRTADNSWILIAVPDQTGRTAWVYASLVQLSVPIEQIPIVEP